jgi:hypothetical protein
MGLEEAAGPSAAGPNESFLALFTGLHQAGRLRPVKAVYEISENGPAATP